MEPNSPGSLRSYHISISWPLFWLFCKPLHPQMCKSINVLVKIIFVNILPNSSFLRLMEWLCVFLICNLPHPLKGILPLPNWYSRVLWCRIIRQFGGVRGWNVLMLGWQRRHWALEIAVDWAAGSTWKSRWERKGWCEKMHKFCATRVCYRNESEDWLLFWN